MIEIIQTIELIKTDLGYIVSPASQEDIKNRKDSIITKEIKPSEARSLQQMRYYWKVYLPSFCNNFDGMEQYVNVSETGSHDYTIAHRWLLCKWALEKNYLHLIKTEHVIINGKIEKAATVHFNFNECSHSLACDYMDWISSVYERKYKIPLKEVIDRNIDDV